MPSLKYLGLQSFILASVLSLIFVHKELYVLKKKYIYVLNPSVWSCKSTWSKIN